MRRALGWLFAAVARARFAAYHHGIFRRRALAGPAASVRNLTVAGSGKPADVRRPPARIDMVLKEIGHGLVIE